VPGMRFFHDGQLEGRRVHVAMQLRRRLVEPAHEGLQAFHDRLLEALARPEAHEGQWRLCSSGPAWVGNSTHEQLVAMTWTAGEARLLAVANYGPMRAQGLVPLPQLPARPFTFIDRLGPARYQREGGELAGRGLYLDLPAWGHHLFELAPG
jgi:hypothetical protein